MTEMLSRPAPTARAAITPVPLTRTSGKQMGRQTSLTATATIPSTLKPLPTCSTLCPSDCLRKHAGDMSKKGKTGKKGCDFCLVMDDGRKRCMRLCSPAKRRKAWGA